jgi:type I restriction enzyme S subunit
MSFRDCTLGDVVKLQRGHDLPDRIRVEGSTPVVSSSGITGRHNVAKAEPPGVVTGRYGTIGEVFYIDEPYWPLNTALYVVDFKGNNPRYVAYLLRNMLKNYRSEKAAVPGVDRNVLHLMKVRAAGRKEQQDIVEILSAYDDLIENHEKRIALLEKSACLLYREWFVHLRFPGHEHVKVTNGVPQGWRRVAASEAFEINPTTPRNDEGEISYIPMAALSETAMVIDREPLERRENSTAVRFRNGDTRITPCLENGKTGFVQLLVADEVACGSTEFIVLRGRQVSSYYVYLTARQNDFRGNAIKSMTGSSGRQRVQQSCFDRYFVLLPPRQLASLFDEFASLLFDQVCVLDHQNEKLVQARDLLMPRLMNGEIAA